ncbi:hypothetical protein H6F47_04410 [Sphaerospermopsis sp. FACHB-1094]|uniref:hypothetical protein n=1 Tax=Sphaerospermopsis sp. FACHB-1094 TaxID=2692861 RepID=UPI00168274A2|nr:hypothetical protein [Sphaerospermopsis sp. FACHB-1094]MBD2131714.1 hypothetical protein [Sphaerospermopsis sp. FACHB-1094]
MSNQSDWVQICEDVQARLLKITPLTVKSAKVLRSEILKSLIAARDDKFLKTESHQIHNLLKKTPSKDKGIIEITGGKRNFDRIREIPHFERCDGCWFDFAILVDENIKPAEIIAFDFEIRFLENNPTKFLRFDLNLPEHNNDDKGKRFHIHPGNDDLMIHASPMSPLEILHLFLYDLKIPERPRS